MMRTWERAIRRAQLPLVYTQGFSPHARLSLAAPLPVGVTGRCELFDLWVDPAVEPADAAARLAAAVPPGMAIAAVEGSRTRCRRCSRRSPPRATRSSCRPAST